jgi:hypothetical protein
MSPVPLRDGPPDLLRRAELLKPGNPLPRWAVALQLAAGVPLLALLCFWTWLEIARTPSPEPPPSLWVLLENIQDGALRILGFLIFCGALPLYGVGYAGAFAAQLRRRQPPSRAALLLFLAPAAIVVVVGLLLIWVAWAR